MNTAVEVQDFLSGLTAERDRYKAQAQKEAAIASRAVKAAEFATAELNKRLTEICTLPAATIRHSEHAGDALVGTLAPTTIVRAHVLALREGGLAGVSGADEAESALVDASGEGEPIRELREVLLTGGARLAVALADGEELLGFKSWIGRAAVEKKS
jgi:hypothetical protein